MQTLNPQIIRARQLIRSLDRSEIQFVEKTAEIGGGQDMPFEQAFSNLAHSYLRDKAPTLQDYEIGFQLIDKNQENTKAVGVFGFKVGSQWLYAPVFFINGDLKGHELLYIKNQDLFVPLKENWLNYLLNRRPHILGEGVDKDLSQLGVMPPNLTQLSRSPSKYASAGMRVAPWAQDVLPDLAYFATTNPLEDVKYAQLRNVVDLIKDAGTQAVKSLIKAVTAYPSLRITLNEMYGEDNIDKAVKEAVDHDILRRSILGSKGCRMIRGQLVCGHEPEFGTAMQSNLMGRFGMRHLPSPTQLINTPQDINDMDNTPPGNLDTGGETGMRSKSGAEKAKGPKSRNSIRVVKFEKVETSGIHGGGGTTLDSFGDKDREQLIRGEIIIKDTRDDKSVSIAYDIDLPQKLQSPSETGLYDVLVSPGTFKKCFIAFGPYDTRGRKNFVTVVDTKGKSWINIHPSHIWTRNKYTREAFIEWFKGLSNKDEPKEGEQLRMIITPSGQATLPFQTKSKIDGEFSSFEVAFKNEAKRKRPGSLTEIDWAETEPEMWATTQYAPQPKIVLTDKPGKAMRAMGLELFIPDGYKVLNLDPTPDPEEECSCDETESPIGKNKDSKELADNKSEGDEAPKKCKCDAASKEPAVYDLAHQADMFVNLIKAGGLEPMTIRHSGTHISINDQHGLDKTAALVSLVKDHGLREKQARDLIDIAKENKVQSYLIKYAAPYDLQRSNFSTPAFPDPQKGADPSVGGETATQDKMEANLPIPGLQAGDYDRSVYDVRPGAYSQDNSVGGSNSPGPDQKTLGMAMQAAQSGQKEVFDTSMLGSMLKAVRDDSMVDKYMGDLMKGMDRIARILFMFYWRQDEFEERYGKQDMPELEDSLRNAFETIGDLNLFLKQRSIEPYPDEQTSVDLKSISES